MHLGTGDDKINGFGGDDTVYGASGGDDLLNGGTHNEGGDTISYAEAEGPVSISLITDQSGVPQASPHFLADGWGNGTDEFFNFETIIISSFDDLFVSEDAVDAIQLNGIRIDAGGGNDVIRSGSSGDILKGGAGADELYGGAGNDVLVFDAADTAVFGGAGRDVAVAVTDQGVAIDMTASEVEVVIGGAGNDTIVAGDSGEARFIAGGGLLIAA